MAKRKYWFAEKGMSFSNAFEVETTAVEAEWVARDAAADYWENHEGWASVWPVVLTVQMPDGSEHSFNVMQEYEPVFDVDPVEEDPDESTPERREKIGAKAAGGNRPTAQSVQGRPRNLSGCVAGMIGNMEALGIGDETREVNGAEAVDLLNQYLPLLREELAGSSR